MENLTTYIIIGLFVLGSAFFSSAETSFAALQLYKIESAQKEKPTFIRKIVISLKRNEVRTITTILILNNIVNLTAATYTAISLESVLGANAAVLGTMIITILIIIFGEIIPKTLASTYPLKFAKFTSVILWPLALLIYPISIFLGFLAKNDAPTSTEKELKHLVNTIHNEGVLEQDESTLIKKAMDFDDIIVKKVMTSADKVEFLKSNLTYESVIEAFKSTTHSRLPVVSGKKVKGIIIANDFFRHGVKGMARADFNIKAAPVVKPTDHLQKVLEEIRKSSVHMAIVEDRNNQWVGIVTLEDLLEQLVGDIYDESDKKKEIVLLGANRVKVSGSSKIKEIFKDYFNSPTPDTKCVTAKEWVNELNNGHPCFEGLKLREDNYDYLVEELTEVSCSIIIHKRSEDNNDG